jgi:pimeloyl-ACP methyl ester carboxylesterase
VIEQTGVRDATLVGYSMGGGEVVRYLSRHSGRNIGDPRPASLHRKLNQRRLITGLESSDVPDR